jgi:IgGFc binding protein
MSHDLLDRTASHEMTERNVAQPQRNKRSDVAQRARRDHSPYTAGLDLGLGLGLRLALGLAAAIGLGLGCANPTSRADGAPKDSGASDAARGGCADDCAATGLYCSLGRCTSMACQESETTGQGIAGCLFYTLQADNVTADEDATTSFLVANAGLARANVTLEEAAQPASGETGWTEMAEFQIDVAASRRIPVDGLQVTGVGVSLKAALRISSDQPVTVSEIESDDVASVATSSGGTMVLPLQSLGSVYLAVTYPQELTSDVQMTAGSRGGAARVIVVGTRDGTLVTFSPVGPVTGDPDGGTPDIPALGSYQVTLDDGDVFQIYSGAPGEDLTGAQVSASAPVAVFSGNISTSYGSTVTGINSADMAHEQMPPLSSWSTSYVAAALTPQASIGCTSFFGMDGASIWRVLSSKNQTVVTVVGPGIPMAKYTLDAGAVQTLVEVGSFTVTATNPILVTQGIDCEPSLSLAVAAVGVPNLLTSLPFAVPPSFDLLLAVVRPTGVEVELDGAPISEAMFVPVGPGFDVASVPLAACTPTDGSGVCTYLLTSTTGFGMSLRGMDVGSSFALTAPLLVGCGPNKDVCLN